MTSSISSRWIPRASSLSGSRPPSKAKMSRPLASHLSPAPVSIRIHFPAERTRSEFIARVTRLRSSGGNLRSQSGRGMTPNMAPPSRRKVPSVSRWNSRSPSFIVPPNFAPPGTAGRLLDARSSQDLAHGGIGIYFSSGHFCCELCQRSLAADIAQDALEQAGFEQIHQAFLPMGDLFCLAVTAGLKVPAKIRDRTCQGVDALILGGDRADHHRLPTPALGHEVQHGVELLLESFGAFAVGLVDHENIADLHESRLHVLHVIAEARHEHHQGAVRQAHDIDFVLADPHGFDQHQLFARGVEQQRDIAGGPSQAAEEASRRHRADVNAGVGGVALHADAVAQDGAACERAGGVHSNDADGLLLAPVKGCPVEGNNCRRICSAWGSWFSMAVMARDMARTSPARTCSAQLSTAIVIATKREATDKHRSTEMQAKTGEKAPPGHDPGT